jgi:hypothetical protein
MSFALLDYRRRIETSTTQNTSTYMVVSIWAIALLDHRYIFENKNPPLSETGSCGWLWHGWNRMPFGIDQVYGPA